MVVMTRRAALATAALAPLAARAEGSSTRLSLWYNHPEWKGRMAAILARFEAAHPGITVDLQEMPNTAYVPRLDTALAAGEAPDLFALRSGTELVAASKAGYITDLTGKIDMGSVTSEGVDASQVQGRLFGVPAVGKYTVALFYNRDLLERNGITPPTTWAELTTACQALKAKGVVPMICPAQDASIPGFTYSLLASCLLGQDGFLALRKGQRKLTDPDLLPAAAFFRDLYAFYQPGALGTAYTEGKALFALGRGAMMVGGSADYAGYLTMNPKANLGVVAFPAAPGGLPATITGMQGIISVNSKSKSIPQAIAFLQWMLGREASQMVLDTITLSTSREVQPSDNRVMREMMQAATKNDIRAWFEVPEVAKVFNTVGTQCQKLFIGEQSVDGFAAALQAVVEANPGL